jgi:hypothetical protein
MAKASINIIAALRRTAEKLEQSAEYQWGHMGSCNCGFLAQEITRLRKDEIHARAMQRHGDWNEQLNDYCATSGLPMDELIGEMIAFGFDADDLKHLERLSDQRILQTLPLSERNLSHNVKADVTKYIRQWAAMLEQELLKKIDIADLKALLKSEPLLSGYKEKA